MLAIFYQLPPMNWFRSFDVAMVEPHGLNRIPSNRVLIRVLNLSESEEMHTNERDRGEGLTGCVLSYGLEAFDRYRNEAKY